MALPEEVATVNLTGTYVNLDGTPTVGYLMFEPSPQILKAADSREFVVPKVMQVNLDENGAFSIQLPANDDPDVEPLGWTYQVTEAFGARRVYSIEIHIASGPTQNIYDLAPVALSNGTFYEQGDRGPAGPPALIVTGQPANTVGMDGDHALDVQAGMFYTKTASAWDNGTQLGLTAAPLPPVKTYIDNADAADKTYSDGKLSTHASTSSGTHGVVGLVVGTTDTQTLSNKILSAPSVTGGLSADTLTTTGAATVASLKVNGALDATGQTITAAHVTVSTTPTAATDAATKGYVDSADALRVQIGGDLGGTVTAPTVTVGTHHTHTSVQVTDATYNGVASKVMMTDASGNTTVNLLSLGAQQNVANSATRKDYVDGQDLVTRRVAVHNVSTAAYTLALTDEGQVVYYNTDATAVAITIPLNSAVAFPIGAWVDIYQGNGPVTVTGAAGVTLRGPDGQTTVTTRALYSKIRLTKSSTDTWQWSGDATTVTTSTVASATASPTVGALAKRDAAGRFQAVDPSVAADVATKNYVDTKAAAVSSVAGKTGAVTLVSADITDASTTATTSTLVKRDANGGTGLGYSDLLVQQSAPTNPISAFSRFYLNANSRATILSSTGVSRVTQYSWGSGTAFPTTDNQAGDTFVRTDIGSATTIWQFTGQTPVGYQGWIPEGPIFCTSTTRPTAALFKGLQIIETDTMFVWQWDGTSHWLPVTPGACAGKAWFTSGMSGNMTAGTNYAVLFNASRVSGGVTMNSNQMVLPLDGMWEIQMRGYCSGGSNGADLFFYARRIRASVADLSVVTLAYTKENGNDRMWADGDVVPLKAGDQLYQWASTSITGTNYFGSSEAAGVMLRATWVAPLNGATPL